MARKKKKRAASAGPLVAPWIILGSSLLVIGYACSHKEPASHVAAKRHRPAAVAIVTPTPQPAAPVAPPATPTPSPTTLPTAPPPTAPPSVVTTALAAPPPATATTASPATSSPATSSPATSAPATSAPATPAPPTPVPHAPRHVHPAAPGAPGTARLALIIDDCGQWLTTERGFIALPVMLTMSVLPDVRYNHTIEREAADANKGIMLHLPMETISGLNPGPGKVTTTMSDAAIATQVGRDLDDVDLALGVNNHEGSKATADPRVMNAVMTVLAQRSRFFVDSMTNGKSVASRVASEHGVPTAARDVFLDNKEDVAYTEGQLREAAAIAKRDGSAIAIGHPRPTTLAAVRALIPELHAAGITFVLVSDLTH